MSANRHGINATAVVRTGDVFTARVMDRLLGSARKRQDGALELEMTTEMFEDVLASMERDGIDVDAEYATVSTKVAGEIAVLRASSN